MQKIKTLFIAATLLFYAASLAPAAGNETNDSFSRAKKMLEQQVYFDHRVTVYCGAPFDEKKNIDLPVVRDDCGERSDKPSAGA